MFSSNLLRDLFTSRPIPGKCVLRCKMNHDALIYHNAQLGETLLPSSSPSFPSRGTILHEKKTTIKLVISDLCPQSRMIPLPPHLPKPLYSRVMSRCAHTPRQAKIIFLTHPEIAKRSPRSPIPGLPVPYYVNASYPPRIFPNMTYVCAVPDRV